MFRSLSIKGSVYLILVWGGEPGPLGSSGSETEEGWSGGLPKERNRCTRVRDRVRVRVQSGGTEEGVPRDAPGNGGRTRTRVYSGEGLVGHTLSEGVCIRIHTEIHI